MMDSSWPGMTPGMAIPRSTSGWSIVGERLTVLSGVSQMTRNARSNLTWRWLETTSRWPGYEVTDAGSLAKLGVWTTDGTSKWTQTVSAAGGNGRNPVLLTNGHELFCAWIEHDGRESALWGRWISLDGRALTPPQRLAPVGETTWNLNAALDEGGHPWVVFDAPAPGGIAELFLVRVGVDGPQLIQLTGPDGAASTYPDIALRPDRLALTWF